MLNIVLQRNASCWKRGPACSGSTNLSSWQCMLARGPTAPLANHSFLCLAGLPLLLSFLAEVCLYFQVWWPVGKEERDSDEGNYYIVKRLLHFRSLHRFQARSSLPSKKRVGHFCRFGGFKGIWMSLFKYVYLDIPIPNLRVLLLCIRALNFSLYTYIGWKFKILLNFTIL